MQLVVFRSRLREDAQGYAAEAATIAELARAQPGLLSFKTFTAADGERVTLAEFESAESVAAWREHPRHRTAQEKGRADFYAEYRIQVCAVLRERAFVAPALQNTNESSESRGQKDD